ncbi:hypothetical protein KPL70_027190 [Citrus sinensis]|nr:hypothetical protein KPL70_027190 [Citrus sinensis]
MPPKSTPQTTERTSSKFWMPSGFMLACLLAFTLQIFFSLPPVSSDSLLPMISTFQGLIKLGEGVVNYPEDVAVDRNGVVYTAARDGWIMRLQNNGTWENWKLIRSQTLLGITATKEKNNLIVCDSDKVNSSAVETVHSSKNRKQLLEEHPELINQLMSTGKGAAAKVVKVSANGSIIREFNDPNAKNISFVTSALEFHGNLYLASINSNFIGKLPLK